MNLFSIMNMKYLGKRSIDWFQLLFMKDLSKEVIIGPFVEGKRSFIFLMMKRLAKPIKYVTRMLIFYVTKKMKLNDVYDYVSLIIFLWLNSKSVFLLEKLLPF